MANVSTNLLKLKKGSCENFEKLIREINTHPGVIHSEKISENRIDFLAIGDLYNFLSDASYDLELEFECINYDTAIGYANKSIFNNGHDLDCRSISYGMDMECELMDSCSSDEEFFKVLKKHIEKYGENKSSVVKEGDSILINELLCQDEEVLKFAERQKIKPFIVSDVDYATNGVWIKDFNCRIDIDEVIVIN